ncbi:MAG: glycosyltransferase family 9 protein [bacterium]
MNILIIKLSSIGDCLLATPAIESIRKGHPDSFITWLVEDKAKDIAMLNPYVDEVMVIDKKKFKIRDYLSLIKKLRSRRYDLSVDLQGVDRTAIFAFLSSSRARYVEEYADLGFLSNKKIPRKGRPLEHAVKFYLYLATKAGGEKIEEPELTLVASEEDKKYASDFLENNFGITAGITAGTAAGSKNIFVGINPTGMWKTKRWPVKYFIKLSKELIDSFNANIVIFGSKGEEYFAEEILNSLKPQNAAKNLASSVGKTTLKQAKELLAKMDYFITPDSGLMHVASTVKTLKTLSLFGPTDPELTGPVGKNSTVLRDNLICIPCFKKECPLNKIENNNLTECVLCMKRITPDSVFDIIKKDLEIKGRI